VTVPPSYDGDIFRPKDTQTYPGKRPAIVLMHGGKGGKNFKCALYWAARLLAAHGYVTLILTDTYSETEQVSLRILATERAIEYVRSPSNPFAAYIDRDNLGLAGHSNGARAVDYVQGIQGISPYVKAIVALDNLEKFRYGDPAIALHCAGAMAGQNTPRVPALGMASNHPCATDPGKTDKQYGWKAWRAAGLPSMELVMAGFEHEDFTTGSTDDAKHEAKLKKVAYYMLAWFNRYLLNDTSQDAKLLSSHPLGRPIADMLSARPSKAFHSAAFIPGKIDCNDLLPCLQKVSAQVEPSKPAPQMVLSNP
jgi:hypothetical protein